MAEQEYTGVKGGADLRNLDAAYIELKEKVVAKMSDGTDLRVSKDIQFEAECEKHVSADDLKTIMALADAIEVLSALERAPVHQDTHSSHDIKTGGGYAQNHRLDRETLPVLAGHIAAIARDLDDRLDTFFNKMEAGVCHG